MSLWNEALVFYLVLQDHLFISETIILEFVDHIGLWHQTLIFQLDAIRSISFKSLKPRKLKKNGDRIRIGKYSY